MPACLKMLRWVFAFRSFVGCLTVTIPFFVGCLYWWCEPFVRASVQPSAVRIWMTSREERLLLMRSKIQPSSCGVNNYSVVVVLESGDLIPGGSTVVQELSLPVDAMTIGGLALRTSLFSEVSVVPPAARPHRAAAVPVATAPNEHCGEGSLERQNKSPEGAGFLRQPRGFHTSRGDRI